MARSHARWCRNGFFSRKAKPVFHAAKLASALALAGVVAPSSGYATILPPNDLHLEDDMHAFMAMTEKQFNEVSNRVLSIFEPTVNAHGGKLAFSGRWSSDRVNATAHQSFWGNTWTVTMYGGLARRPEITMDGFAAVVCHELGHHLAGFPFSSSWSANEGQSDFWATQVCLPTVWKEEKADNAKSRETVDPVAKANCDAFWEGEDDQNLCYRISMAGSSLAGLFAAFSNTETSFETRDSGVVERTYDKHPKAQCRLDTYVAGGLCPVSFDLGIIPGKGKSDSVGEILAYDNSCSRRDGHREGQVRPLCWYKPSITSSDGSDEE